MDAGLNAATEEDQAADYITKLRKRYGMMQYGCSLELTRSFMQHRIICPELM